MKRFLVVFLSLILAFFPLGQVQAALRYDPGYIIADEDLFVAETMTVAEIQQFLNEHSGTLKNYVAADVDGIQKSAAAIIYNAATVHVINPQYLLILLQKEQGLITDTNPKQSQLDWATGYAVCDGCDVDHPIVAEYKGFAKQVERAAWRTRYYQQHPEQFNFVAGGEYIIDGVPVFIRNTATAALYNYTPHIHGNKIFLQLWNSWFAPLQHPDASLLQVIGEPGVWYIRDGIRHPFTNKRSLTTRYHTYQIAPVTKEVIEQYQIGPPISFPEYSLVRIPSGKIFLLADSELRWIVDEEIFKQLGYMPDEVEQVSEADIAFFPAGEPIDKTTLEPIGSLVQDPDSFGIFFVKNGVKHPLIAPELLSLNFSHLRSRQASRAELDRYTLGSPVKLKDGLLVKNESDPRVYVITNQTKHPIDSEYSFLSLGYKWSSIQIVSQRLLDLHTLGDTISISKPLTDEEAQALIKEL